MAHRVHLSRPCPLKLKPTFDAAGNFTCTHCSENVRDFTQQDAETMLRFETAQDHSCGTFRKVYYPGLAGRIQIRLVKQLDTLRGNRKTVQKLWLPFVVLLAFLMGCRTRSGAPAYGVKQKPAPVERHEPTQQKAQ